MKKFLFGGAALAVLAALPALAQPGVDRGRSAEPVTRAAIEARVKARFDRADANRDGFVTRDEVRARAEARRGQRQERRSERRERRFEQLDANNDGSISRAEFDAPRGVHTGDRGERRAMRSDRRGQRFAHRGGRGGMMGGFGGHGFAAMDSDRDGRISLAEANRQALGWFDGVDTDRDGAISQAEREAARAAWRERRQR